ncbi:MAG: helix-turn-helix transcriptional regulator [Oscillospiraceae bacterium]|nr:helix-turn-helix transcriptional regulator [Oscillospiraceae bacterium]
MIKSNEVFGKIRSKGLTIAEAAEKIGMNPQTLSRKIKGDRRIFHDEITSIALVLGMTDAEVLDFFYPEVSKKDTREEHTHHEAL